MKAARLHGIGDLRCEEVDVPVPHGEELPQAMADIKSRKRQIVKAMYTSI